MPSLIVEPYKSLTTRRLARGSGTVAKDRSDLHLSGKSININDLEKPAHALRRVGGCRTGCASNAESRTSVGTNG